MSFPLDKILSIKVDDFSNQFLNNSRIGESYDVRGVNLVKVYHDGDGGLRSVDQAMKDFAALVPSETYLVINFENNFQRGEQNKRSGNVFFPYTASGLALIPRNK